MARLSIIISLYGVLSFFVGGSRSMCLAWQPCFPSSEDLTVFNASVDGMLFTQRPVGAVCYREDPLYNQALCNTELASFTSDQWRADTSPAYVHSTPARGIRILKELHIQVPKHKLRVPNASMCPFPLPYKNYFVGETCGIQDACYVPNPTNATGACGQGNIPSYAVHAQTAGHVQKYIKFAAQHDLRSKRAQFLYDSSSHLPHR